MMADVIPIISTDRPTRELIRAFEQCRWWASDTHGPWALLRSPDRQHSIVIRVDPAQPDRVIEVKQGPGGTPGEPIALSPIGIDEAIEFVRTHRA